MTVEVSINALEIGTPMVIDAGKTLRVYYSFGYKVAEAATVPLWASLYQAAIVDREERAQTKTVITLDKSMEWQAYQGQVDISIGTGTPGGVYGLIVEIPGFKDAQAKIANILEVKAAPGMGDWLGQLAVLGILGMVMRLVTNTTKRGTSK